MHRRVLAPLMMGLCAWLVSGCGVSYPGDRANWALVQTPNEIPGATLEGEIVFLENGDARLLETASNDATDQERFVLWEGTWEGDGATAEVTLACTDTTSKNVDEITCASATLSLSCKIAGEKLDCGSYVFQ